MLESIITLLNTNDWRVKFDTNCQRAGGIEEEDGLIVINPLRGDRIVVLIHECTHILHEDWTEEKVEASTARCYKRLTREHEQILLYYLQELRL